MKNIVQIKANSFTDKGVSIKSRIRAFTLIELLIALMVSSIILTAIVTLSYAMSSAYDCTSDINQKEAHIRYTTMRISNLIKYSRLICKATSGEILIWKSDDNNDNKINISELTYIETGNGTYLRLLKFNPTSGTDDFYSLSFIQNYTFFKQWIIFKYPETYTTLINDCSNMSIATDADPPYTQHVSISFDIKENQQSRKCQISTSLLCQMSSFIDSYGNVISEDDDF